MFFQPKDNPYQPLAAAATSLFKQFRQKLEERGELEPELQFVLDEVEAMQDPSQAAIFRMRGMHFAETSKSAERFQTFLASQAKAESDRMSADQLSAAAEQQRRL